MSGVPDWLTRIYERNAKALGWVWIPDTDADRHVLSAGLQPIGDTRAFTAGDDYVVVRLAEMYLRRTRLLWREYYPLVHAFVGYGDPAAPKSIGTVAGPGQLKDLGTNNLDRIIGLSYRLAGPVVYDGQDVELLAGLYGVPAKDGAKLLIDTLSQLAGLVPALKQATDIAGIVKAGIEGLIGMSGTNLVLGVHDTLRAPARPGFIVAINAPATSVEANLLWVKDWRLYEGPNPIAAKPFESHDMMLFEVHRGPSRAATWGTLPALTQHASAFDAALRETPVEQLPSRINELFRKFEADLRASPDLTRPDKDAIRALVGEDLKKRHADIKGGALIETRSVSGLAVETNPRSFAPRDINYPPAGAPLPARAEGVQLFP